MHHASTKHLHWPRPTLANWKVLVLFVPCAESAQMQLHVHDIVHVHSLCNTWCGMFCTYMYMFGGGLGCWGTESFDTGVRGKRLDTM